MSVPLYTGRGNGVASITGGLPVEKRWVSGGAQTHSPSLVLENGKRLFEDKDDRRSLEFVDTRTLGTGVI